MASIAANASKKKPKPDDGAAWPKLAEDSAEWFLGFDISTQGVKATCVAHHGGNLSVVYRASVNYDKDLPQFGTTGGMHRRPAPGGGGTRVTSPALMWVAGVDLLLARMRAGGFAFARVAALSGSGQQHGSVYWSAAGVAALGALDPAEPLAPQLERARAFAVADSPIWADSSTGPQCAALERALGGAGAVATATGSRAYERFTGNQIAKVRADDPAGYAAAARVSLVSSFGASLFAGAVAPIDSSDGSGMNLMRIAPGGDGAGGPGSGRRWSWHEGCLAAAAGGAGAAAAALRAKLGPVAGAAADVGALAPYFAARYGFAPACRVVAWSGDNPCSLQGLGLGLGDGGAGDVAVSLGTSDTLFAITNACRPGVEGHVFAGPNASGVCGGGGGAHQSYMAMLCFKNGSLVRQAVCDAHFGGDWEKFGNAITRIFPGGALETGGCYAEKDGAARYAVGFYFPDPEITPTTRAGVTARFRGGWSRAAGPTAQQLGAPASVMEYPSFEPKSASEGLAAELSANSAADDALYDKAHQGGAALPWSPGAEARAVVESRFLSMRLHAGSVGVTRVGRVLATGGASANAALLQVLADVFGAPVFTAAAGGTDSASLGGALRALQGTLLRRGAGPGSYPRGAVAKLNGFVLAATPDTAAHREISECVLPLYAHLEAKVVARVNNAGGGSL